MGICHFISILTQNSFGTIFKEVSFTSTSPASIVTSSAVSYLYIMDASIIYFITTGIMCFCEELLDLSQSSHMDAFRQRQVCFTVNSFSKASLNILWACLKCLANLSAIVVLLIHATKCHIHVGSKFSQAVLSVAKQ